MTTRVDFEGGRELEAALESLGERGAIRRTATRALEKAAEVIRDEAIRLAPDSPKSGPGKYLRESIKIGRRAETKGGRQFRRTSGQDQIEVYVGIDGSVLPAKEPESDERRRRAGGGSSGGAVAFYSQAIELGLGSTPAQPYLRPAYDNKKQEALDELKPILWEEIRKTAERQARKSARLAARGRA